MKRFMYVSIGVLALAAAFHLGAQVGRANWLQVIGVGEPPTGGAWVILDTGGMLSWDEQFGWQGRPALPFPAEELKFFTGRYAIDTSNHLWYYTGQWQHIGPPPGVAGVGDDPSLRPSTWGQVKQRGGQ